MATAVGIGRFVYTPILPPMQAALGLSQSAAGLIAAANFAGYLVGALAVARPGWLGMRRIWLLGGLIASGVTTGAMALTTSLLAFLLLRFAGGVASALVLIQSSSLVLEWLAETRRPGLAALHFAGVGGGIATSATLVAALLIGSGGWGSLWLATGALSLVATLAVAALLPTRVEGSASTAARSPAKPADARLTRLILAYGLFGFGYVITATFLVTIVRATPATRVLEPVIWIVVGLAAAPSVALWNRVGRWVGTPTAFAIAALAEAIGVMASAVWLSRFGVFLAAVLLGGTFMGLTALGLIRGRELAHGNAQQVIAVMTGAFGLGQIIGPLLAGVLSDVLGGFMVPSLAAAAALMLAAVLVRSQ